MSLLITGAAGFIGSHLVDRLILDGQSVISVDNMNSFYNPRIKRLNLKAHLENPSFRHYKLDIRDSAAMVRIFARHDISIVIHLAAMAGVRPSLENPQLYTDVNITGLQVLLEQAAKHQVKHFVFASSSSVYGNNEKTPFSEDDLVDAPISPYGATKKMGELLCYTYHHLYDLPVTCMRFFTVYGPRQRPEMAIHKFIRRIFRKEAIPFFGDGSTARDYTYIGDIIQGISKIIGNPEEYIIYNLGNSDPIKLSELVDLISEITGIPALIETLPLPPGDVIQTYANIERARYRLGYSPSTNIKDGITEFVDWYRFMRQKHRTLYA